MRSPCNSLQWVCDDCPSLCLYRYPENLTLKDSLGLISSLMRHHLPGDQANGSQAIGPSEALAENSPLVTWTIPAAPPSSHRTTATRLLSAQSVKGSRDFSYPTRSNSSSFSIPQGPRCRPSQTQASAVKEPPPQRGEAPDPISQLSRHRATRKFGHALPRHKQREGPGRAQGV